MHELSIARAIIDAAAGHAGGRRVTRVYVRIGRMRQVVPVSLDFYFGIAARQTPCEGAELRHTTVPARLRCRGCGHDWELDRPEFRCPRCAGTGAEVVSGDELEVESIEVEEEPCTARR